MSQAAAEAAYFVGLQEGAGAAQGGVLAHLAAKLAAKLKVWLFLVCVVWCVEIHQALHEIGNLASQSS